VIFQILRFIQLLCYSNYYSLCVIYYHSYLFLILYILNIVVNISSLFYRIYIGQFCRVFPPLAASCHEFIPPHSSVFSILRVSSYEYILFCYAIKLKKIWGLIVFSPFLKSSLVTPSMPRNPSLNYSKLNYSKPNYSRLQPRTYLILIN